MSRGKLGYDFTPTPRKWHSAWAESTLFMRGLRASLFELADGGPIAVDADWLTSLCKQMHVGGRERPNVRKALLSLESEGMLTVADGTVSVVFLPTSARRPVDIRPTSVAPLVDIPIESTACNDSTHVRQTRQTDKTDEERVRVPARETKGDVVDLKPPVQTSAPSAKRAADKLYAITLRWYDPRSDEHRESLEALGERPDAEWAKAAEVIESEMTKPSVAGMMTPKHLLAKWGKYSNGEAPVGRAELQRQRDRAEQPQARGVWAKAGAQ